MIRDGELVPFGGPIGVGVQHRRAGSEEVVLEVGQSVTQR